MEAEDLEAASAVIRAAYEEYRGVMRAEHWDWYIRHAVDVWSRLDEAELIVAEIAGQVVGAVTFYPDAAHSREEGWPPVWAVVSTRAP